MGDSAARKLLERARKAPRGWKRGQLDRLYESYGFTIKSQSRHDIVTHPEFRDLRAALTRSSGELHPDYVRHAVDLISEMLRRSAKQEEEQ
jgi:hypothetical protein